MQTGIAYAYVYANYIVYIWRILYIDMQSCGQYICRFTLHIHTRTLTLWLHICICCIISYGNAIATEICMYADQQPVCSYIFVAYSTLTCNSPYASMVYGRGSGSGRHVSEVAKSSSVCSGSLVSHEIIINRLGIRLHACVNRFNVTHGLFGSPCLALLPTTSSQSTDTEIPTTYFCWQQMRICRRACR